MLNLTEPTAMYIVCVVTSYWMLVVLIPKRIEGRHISIAQHNNVHTDIEFHCTCSSVQQLRGRRDTLLLRVLREPRLELLVKSTSCLLQPEKNARIYNTLPKLDNVPKDNEHDIPTKRREMGDRAARVCESSSNRNETSR